LPAFVPEGRLPFDVRLLCSPAPDVGGRRLQENQGGAGGPGIPRHLLRGSGGQAPPHRSRPLGYLPDARERRRLAGRGDAPDEGRDRRDVGRALSTIRDDAAGGDTAGFTQGRRAACPGADRFGTSQGGTVPTGSGTSWHARKVGTGG